MSRYSMDTVQARPLNCSPALGDKERCPYCGQFHLRPGYCQALDPINAKKYPGIWDGTIHVNMAHFRDYHETDKLKVPFSHRAETETDNSESLETNDFSDTETDTETDNSIGRCEVCGETFLMKRIDSRYCSPACRLKAYRRKRQEERGE